MNIEQGMKNSVLSRKFTSAFNIECLIFIIFFIAVFSFKAEAQDQQKEVSPRGAFLRSMVVPGWGHYYANNDNWNAGKYHLAADAVLILTYFGLDIRADNLETNFYTLAQSKAGADLDTKDRNFEIAIGNYDNLSEYNDAQLQLRNWDQVYENTPENQWNWENDDYRFKYQDIREKVDRTRGQLPTLLSLMVVNRLWSGISAFVRARDLVENMPEAQFSYLNQLGEPGVTATLKFSF